MKSFDRAPSILPESLAGDLDGVLGCTAYSLHKNEIKLQYMS